jgi:CTD kinase subunit beta
MAPEPAGAAPNGDSTPPVQNQIGPHPSYIQVAKSYIPEQDIKEQLLLLGANEAKEDAIRLQGVAFIDSIRRTLQL